MFNARHGGLTGKARRAREESRSSRLCAQQMIAEFIDPETGPRHRRARTIRLGHRSEFIPSTVCAIRELDGAVGPEPEPLASGAGTQLEFPLVHDGVQRHVNGESPGPIGRQHPPKARGSDTSTGPVISSAPAAATSSIKPIRPPRANQANADPNPFVPASRKTRAGVQPARQKQAMTFAGFFYGCALGGAAAAGILLLLHFAVG